jgi:hypothetical protein
MKLFLFYHFSSISQAEPRGTFADIGLALRRGQITTPVMVISCDEGHSNNQCFLMSWIELV